MLVGIKQIVYTVVMCLNNADRALSLISCIHWCLNYAVVYMKQNLHFTMPHINADI